MTKTTGHEDGVDPAEQVLCPFCFYFFGINPNYLDLGGMGIPGMVQGFHHTEVGIREGGVLPYQGDFYGLLN